MYWFSEWYANNILDMQVILLYNYMLQALVISITSAASELEAD